MFPVVKEWLLLALGLSVVSSSVCCVWWLTDGRVVTIGIGISLGVATTGIRVLLVMLMCG